uniref:Protein FAM48A n=1 Tax=Apis cerana TaxID=7461 RepID=V9IHU3_APICE
MNVIFLGRLVQREGLHTLIVNLYAGNKGYSLAIRNSDKGNQYDKNSILAETQLMGYEQGELLSCIDNGQLPAMLAEQLETNHSHLFYDGCIIAEVRDYRKTFPHTKAEVHHVLLKPTTQSVLSDVSTLTSDGDWSHEERLMLESHLVAATQGPLCLDPNPIPSLATTRLKQSKSLLTDHQLMRQAKKFSQVTVNRKRKLEQLAQPEGLTIQDLMQKLRAKRGK